MRSNMSSGTEIVKKALQKIGQHSQISPANPVSIENGVDVLNSLMQLWLSQGIDLGIVPILEPGNDINEPMDSTQVIINSLALELAPDYDDGNSNVSETLKNNARRGFSRLSGLYRVKVIPDKIISSTTPLGAGNSLRWRFNRNFAGRDATVKN